MFSHSPNFSPARRPFSCRFLEDPVAGNGSRWGSGPDAPQWPLCWAGARGIRLAPTEALNRPGVYSWLPRPGLQRAAHALAVERAHHAVAKLVRVELHDCFPGFAEKQKHAARIVFGISLDADTGPPIGPKIIATSFFPATGCRAATLLLTASPSLQRSNKFCRTEFASIIV